MEVRKEGPHPPLVENAGGAQFVKNAESDTSILQHRSVLVLYCTVLECGTTVVLVLEY